MGLPGRSLVFMGMSKELESLKRPSSGLGNSVILYCKLSQERSGDAGSETPGGAEGSRSPE